QLLVGVTAGVRRALIANQLVQDIELAAVQSLWARHADLRIVFLVDSLAQVQRIEAWSRAHRAPRAFQVLLEIGVPARRTGLRDHVAAISLSRALHASPALRLVGIECYEGLGASGDDARDAEYASALMQRVAAVAQACEREGLFEADEVIVSAGGSGIFDLV